MHLLLPPSEAKSSGGRGRALRDRVEDGPLGAARTRVRAALLEAVSGDRDEAARALLLPAGVADEAIATNANMLDAPTTPALRRYAGVVYDGLDVASFSRAEQRLAARCTLIFSGLFGVVRGGEMIPAYRVPGKAVLPGLGVASTFWRPVLAGVLAGRLSRGLVVDLRSSDYAPMWRPGPEAAGRVVAVRILSPAPRGGYAVISYNSKLAKGRLAAALIRRAAKGDPLATACDVIAAWADAGGAGHECGDGGRLDLFTA